MLLPEFRLVLIQLGETEPVSGDGAGVGRLVEFNTL